MVDTYYAINFKDCAMPAFCTFTHVYFGTQSELMQVASNLEKDNISPETSKAIIDYFNGDTSATHTVAFWKYNVLTPVEVLAEQEFILENHKWTHINIWGFPYEMKSDFIKAHQLIFKYENKIYRTIKGRFKNLCYDGIDNWVPVKGTFWGNKFLLNVEYLDNGDDFIFSNILYHTQEIYEDDLEKAMSDMRDINKLEFKDICNEIFGDG